MDESLFSSIEAIVSAVALFAALSTLVIGISSGVLRRIKLGTFELEASPKEKKEAEAVVRAFSGPHDVTPSEVEQLAKYYAQVLAQSKISFWFSLIFASLGFVVIILAGFMYKGESTGATIVQLIAGVVIDAVAALFFVQSKNAQISMSEFSEKLRRDRQQVDARSLAELISNARARDALRIQLALHSAGLANTGELACSIIALLHLPGDSREHATNGTEPNLVAPTSTPVYR